MNQISQKKFEKYEIIKRILSSRNFSVDPYKEINYGLQFRVSDEKKSGIIRIYQSKDDSTKIDYSLVNPKNFKIEIQEIIEDESYKYISNEELKNSNRFGYPIIGTDEAGKGDYFGPLVSAGVYVDLERAKRLAGLGVQDSKNLSDKQNEHIAKKIKKICDSRYSIVEISPYRYNTLYEQLIRENRNLNDLLAWGHAKSIEEILKRANCQRAIIDKFSNEKFVLNKLQERGKKIEIIQIHRAERNIAVAAASILARTRFLEKLMELSEQFNIQFPKGSSSVVIEKGKEFIEKYGKENLNQIAKLHFKTTQIILE